MLKNFTVSRRVEYVIPSEMLEEFGRLMRTEEFPKDEIRKWLKKHGQLILHHCAVTGEDVLRRIQTVVLDDKKQSVVKVPNHQIFGYYITIGGEND